MSDAPLSTGERESRLLDAFVQMADTLVDDYDIADVLHELVSHCVRLLDAAAAGIVLSDQRGGLQVLASSTEQTRMLELYQIQTSEGPCWDCVHSGEPVSVADLAATSGRWPLFVPRALDEGFAAVHAIPMRLRRETIGALNLFGREPGPMPEQDVQAARALADTATIGILQERAIHRGEVLTEQLQVALINRVTIEQAKGCWRKRGTSIWTRHSKHCAPTDVDAARGCPTSPINWPPARSALTRFSPICTTAIPEANYDSWVAALVECGTLMDDHMSFWLARLSQQYPTVEVRAADTAATVDDAILQAVLTRGLVQTALRELDAGIEGTPVWRPCWEPSPERLGRAQPPQSTTYLVDGPLGCN